MYNIQYEGFDTETIEGKAVIIANSKEYAIVKKFDDILNFILKNNDHKVNFMEWNLRYDTQAILKHLFEENYENWRNIGVKIQSKEGYHYTDDILLNYIPNKLFKIKNKKHSTLFYDIAQYYEWNKLDNMAKKYLNKQKIDNAEWVKKSIEFTENKISLSELIKYFNNNTDEIGKYCLLDASLTKDLTYFMYASFLKLNYPFNNPLSMAKIVENYIIKNFSYPRISDKMNKTHNFVKQSFHGGIFDSRIRGFLDKEIFEYDINSAYPYQLSKLDHLANGKLWKVKEPSNNAVMGWYLCEFDSKYIPYKKNIPFFLELFFSKDENFLIPISDTSSFYCTGLRKQIITKLEYDWLKKYTYVKNYGGIEWYKETDNYESPFSWLISAYEKRKEIKDLDKNDIRQLTLKKLYNSAYGKTAQQKHGYSKLTNFFYSSYTTAGCRIAVSEIAINNENNVIEIATDGIYLDKELNIKNSSELGGWEKQIYDKGIFLGSGMKQLYHDNTFTTHLRGITNDRKFDLYKTLKDNKRKNEILFWKNRPIHLNECMIQIHKKELQDLNAFRKVGRKIVVNTDKKHHWDRNYKNFKDFLNNISYSTPFNVHEVDKIYNNYIILEGT